MRVVIVVLLTQGSRGEADPRCLTFKTTRSIKKHRSHDYNRVPNTITLLTPHSTTFHITEHALKHYSLYKKLHSPDLSAICLHGTGRAEVGGDGNRRFAARHGALDPLAAFRPDQRKALPH